MLEIVATPNDDLQKIIENLHEKARILLKKGVYKQKIVITDMCAELCGEDRDATVISNADYAKKRHKDGMDYNTFRTYTLCVTGESCTMRNLTVENCCTQPEKNGQCVALSVNCKRFLGENLNLKSTQDTLFLAPFPDDLVARYSGLTPEPATGVKYYKGFIPHEQLYVEGGALHVFENCRICGTVDFIFGGARAYFKNCELVSLHERRGEGYIAAPCHPLAENGGFTFINCDLLNGGAQDGSVYLARPWRDFGKCTFINCKAEKHVSPALFDKWNGTYRDKTARFYYYGFEWARPVSWAKPLDDLQVNEIINNYNALKSTFFGL